MTTFKIILLSFIFSTFCTIYAAGEINSASPVARIGYARQMLVEKNFTGAINELSMVETSGLSRDERDLYARTEISIRYNLGEQIVPEMIRQYIVDFPESNYMVDVQCTLADFYFFAGRYDEALKVYRGLPSNAFNGEKYADYHYRYALCFLLTSDYDQALVHFKQVAKYKKYSQAIIFYQAYISYVGGDYEKALELFNKVNRNGTLGKESQYYIAQIQYHLGNYEAVLTLGRQLLDRQDLAPEFRVELLRILGESYFYTGDKSESEHTLEQYIQACDDFGIDKARTAIYIVGVLAFDNANYESVIDCMQQAIGTPDALAQSAYLYLGQAYAKHDNFNAVLMAFDKSMNMDFDAEVKETAFFNYAVAQSKGARTPFGSSITNFEKFLNVYPHSRYRLQVEEFLIDAYIHGNDYKKAYQSILRINKPSQEVLKAKQYVCYNLGINEANSENITDAIKYFKEALTIGNQNNGVWKSTLLWLGDCYYNSKNYVSAEKYYSDYMRQINARDAFYYKGMYNLGYSRYQQRKYKTARADFQTAIAKKSNLESRIRADALTRIADTYYYEKNYPAASEAYEKAINTDIAVGDYAMLRNAIVLGLQKQHSKKISTIDRLLGKYPNSYYAAAAMLEKADAQTTLGDFKQAAATFTDLIESYPQSPEARKALLQLAMTNKNEGNMEQAIANYREVVKMYPSSEESTLAVEDLKLIYADRGILEELKQFLSSVPNAPKIETDELDRIEFAAAERAFIGDNSDPSRLYSYIAKYPNGDYATTAMYYLATDAYKNENYDTALEYIDKVLARAVDATFAENALVMKGKILSNDGRHAEAYETYTLLSQKAATTDNKLQARMGIARSGFKTRYYQEAIDAVNLLLSSAESAMNVDEQAEMRLIRADSNHELGNHNEAIAEWRKIAADKRNLYGAQAAIKLSQYYYDNKQYAEAEKELNAMIDSGTPHAYWLARAFILLSDVLVANEQFFEAKEYLESLKANYPGSEHDIESMIESRLNELKGKE